MRKTISVLVVALATAISGSALADTLDCAKNPNVTINEGDVTAKLVGACAKVVINGGDNHLAIESVKSLVVNGTDNVVLIETVEQISVTGVDNKISYRKGISSARPKVSNVGTGNRISQIK